jgi:hypothetical protein
VKVERTLREKERERERERERLIRQMLCWKEIQERSEWKGRKMKIERFVEGMGGQLKEGS